MYQIKEVKNAVKLEYVEPKVVLNPNQDLYSGFQQMSFTKVKDGLQSSNFKLSSKGWKIYNTGNVEFNNGIFRGSLEANSINIPNTTTANSFHADNTGNTWWGATTLATAPAKVTNAGAGTFTNLTATGTFTITGGSGIANLTDAGALATLNTVGTATIDALAVTAAKVASSAIITSKIATGAVTTNEIAANTITATNIATGTITANEMNVSQLSAISADIGAITAGTITGTTITGGTIQTATSGERVVMNLTSGAGLNGGFGSIDSSGNLALSIYPDGSMYNSNYESPWNGSMAIFNNRFSLNSVNSSGILRLTDQDIIDNGASYAKSGVKFGVISYDPLTFGMATKNGTGTNDIGNYWHRNSQVNQVTWGTSLPGYSFAGTNLGSSAKSYKIVIDSVGAPDTFKWSDDGGTTFVQTLVPVVAGPVGSEIGGGINLVSSDNSNIFIYFNSTTGGVLGDYWTFTSGAYSSKSGQVGSFVDNSINNQDEVLFLAKNTVTLTNFYKMQVLATPGSIITIWLSDGTTPNGNLNGTKGDMCLNCSATGQIAYCSSTGATWNLLT